MRINALLLGCLMASGCGNSAGDPDFDGKYRVLFIAFLNQKACQEPFAGEGQLQNMRAEAASRGQQDKIFRIEQEERALLSKVGPICASDLE